jgi:hypothetical protein
VADKNLYLRSLANKSETGNPNNLRLRSDTNKTTFGWTNIKNIRMGTGTVASADIEKIWFGTTALLIADVEG